VAKVYYTSEEHMTWRTFISRHEERAQNNGVDVFSKGLKQLSFSRKTIPEIMSVSQVIKGSSGYELILVDKLLPPIDFFNLLKQSKFPVSISIRPKIQLEFYTSENPDLIHDLFGHCPFLIDKSYADFLRRLSEYSYKKIRNFPQAEKYLSRFYWYTIEFGLVQTPEGIKAYGAGILPSQTESSNALESGKKRQELFNIDEILESDFEVTQTQKIYYVIENMQFLYDFNLKILDQYINKKLMSFNTYRES
jgi:phenylalanine-4-hydroxylase